MIPNFDQRRIKAIELVIRMQPDDAVKAFLRSVVTAFSVGDASLSPLTQPASHGIGDVGCELYELAERIAPRWLDSLNAFLSIRSRFRPHLDSPCRHTNAELFYRAEHRRLSIASITKQRFLRFAFNKETIAVRAEYRGVSREQAAASQSALIELLRRPENSGEAAPLQHYSLQFVETY